jgi:uncharacterized protein (DUF427 family)
MAQTAPARRRERNPDHRVETEPSPRWVRVEINGVTIASSKRPLLLRETGLRPTYYFPREDVRMDLLEPTDLSTHCPYKGDASYWTIKVGDRVEKDAVWSYENPYPEHPEIKEYLAFYWAKVDHWYEEAEEIFKHPRDPYHRVDVIQSTREVRIEINGQTVAESRNPRLLFETGHPTRYYLPREDVRMDLLTPTATESVCPYKGQASYWTAKIGDIELKDIVWSYENPIAECPKVKGLMSFFNEKVDVFVDGERQERPITSWS